MSKEPGQLAAETYLTAWASIDTWETLRQSQKMAWAAAEAAVRADASTDLTQALDQCQKALALLIDPEAICKSRVQDAWAKAVAAEARARAALEKAKTPPAV
jgi:uncharacterized protein YqfA (UPF0365 family)